jgi:NACHT domain
MPDTPPPPDSDPQIKQDVKGDHNQVIGQAIDSTIVNFAGEGQIINLNIHERIPAAFAPPPSVGSGSLTQQEYRQRQVLLNKVRDYWVKGVLETSLHARALIALGLQERLDLVQRPFSGVAEFSDTPGKSLPEGTQSTNVFEQLGAGRTLLILGEPGSGKTISLLKLAEELIVRTEPDLRQPIPVVFNLSSWARKPQMIDQWLVQELLEKYQVSKTLGKSWLETEALILLLDGLDEVKAEQRNTCVQALNQFIQTHGTTEITICCRIRDYQALTDRLTLRSAICIQPLTSEQINFYFDQAGEQLSTLKAVLLQDKELQELAASPLMLSIMSLAYQDLTPEKLIPSSRAEGYHKYLLETYIDRMFQRRGTTQQYSRKETQRWIMWLAQRMTFASQTIFLIERLQPNWLPTMSQRILYCLEISIISGLTIQLVFELVFFLLLPEDSTGLLAGLVFGSFFALIFGRILGSLEDIEPIETLKWSWQEVRNGFGKGLNLGLKIELFIGLILTLNYLTGKTQIGELIAMGPSFASFALISGLLGGLGGLFAGFRVSKIQQTEKPNQGILKSARNALILGIAFGISIFVIFGLIFGLMFGWNSLISTLIFGLMFALPSGLIFGLLGGGNACIRHFALRFTLYRRGYVPWNYAHFLDYATERLLLQKVGGGYIFMHRMLLEHFAEMSLDQEQR